MSLEHFLTPSCNKNAFKWDAYHPLVDRIPACTGQVGVSQHALDRGCVSQHALGRGVSAQGMSAQGGVCPEGCLHRGVWQTLPPRTKGRHPPTRGQTDTCENITFANFVSGGSKKIFLSILCNQEQYLKISSYIF